MDVVLLLGTNALAAGGVFSVAGYQRLARHFASASEAGVSADLYILVATEATTLVATIAPLAAVPLAFVGGTVHVVVDAATVDGGALDALVAAGIRSIILDIRADTDASVLEPLRAACTRAANADATTCVWLEPADDGFMGARAQALVAAGFPEEAITERRLPISSSIACRTSVAPPAELLVGGVECAVYAHALTVDVASGAILPCPRHLPKQHIGRIMDIDDTKLAVRKRAVAENILSQAPCRMCTASARFRWGRRVAAARDVQPASASRWWS